MTYMVFTALSCAMEHGIFTIVFTTTWMNATLWPEQHEFLDMYILCEIQLSTCWT